MVLAALKPLHDDPKHESAVCWPRMPLSAAHTESAFWAVQPEHCDGGEVLQVPEQEQNQNQYCK